MSPAIARVSSDLTAIERADVEHETSQLLACQSVPGLVVHGVLTAIIVGTTSIAGTHPAATAVACVSVLVIGLCRTATRSSASERPDLLPGAGCSGQVPQHRR